MIPESTGPSRPAPPRDANDPIMEDFFEEVNMDLGSKLVSIPDDDSMMHMIGLVMKTHVSEVCSPPRITARASQHGLQPGFALDLTTIDDDGMPWDFDNPNKCEKCKRKIRTEKPSMLIGSPMCTIFSIVQGLNRAKMGQKQWWAAFE